MRDIKFRCFAVQENEMIAPDDVLTIYNNRKLNESLISDDAHIFEQYTGFTDIKGVEIYEGDLIGKDDDKFVRCGVVSFIRGCWMVASKSGERYFNLHWYLSQAEVIGNIHQDPELLEQNDDNLQN